MGFARITVSRILMRRDAAKIDQQKLIQPPLKMVPVVEP